MTLVGLKHGSVVYAQPSMSAVLAIILCLCGLHGLVNDLPRSSSTFSGWILTNEYRIAEAGGGDAQYYQNRVRASRRSALAVVAAGAHVVAAPLQHSRQSWLRLHP
eukprot:IDg6803t1